MNDFTHVNERGDATMVDVSEKEIVRRQAVATGSIRLQPATLKAIQDERIQKGNVFAVARIAGIQAAKQTQALIPLCHQLPLSFAGVEFEIGDDRVEIACTVRTMARTGVEMEALTGVSVAALTIYDMCKAIDKSMTIGEITLKEKTKEPLAKESHGD